LLTIEGETAAGEIFAQGQIVEHDFHGCKFMAHTAAWAIHHD
jgi:hypothetical protein